MPSKAFTEWNAVAQLWLLEARSSWQRANKAWGAIFTTPVNCCAIFYRETRTGDAVGYYQALADALEEARIVENDKLIVSWDGSRLEKDKINPRVEVHLETKEPMGQLQLPELLNL
jgi:hypothetical protein